MNKKEKKVEKKVKKCPKCKGTKFKTHKFIGEPSITNCTQCGTQIKSENIGNNEI